MTGSHHLNCQLIPKAPFFSLRIPPLFILLAFSLSLLLLVSLVGITGTPLNSRPVLAVYVLLLFPAYVSVGYVNYKKANFSLDAKVSEGWHLWYSPGAGLVLQGALGCCGWSGAIHGAVASGKCYARFLFQVVTVPLCVSSTMFSLLLRVRCSPSYPITWRTFSEASSALTTSRTGPGRASSPCGIASHHMISYRRDQTSTSKTVSDEPNCALLHFPCRQATQPSERTGKTGRCTDTHMGNSDASASYSSERSGVGIKACNTCVGRDHAATEDLSHIR